MKLCRCLWEKLNYWNNSTDSWKQDREKRNRIYGWFGVRQLCPTFGIAPKDYLTCRVKDLNNFLTCESRRMSFGRRMLLHTYISN